MPRDSAEIRDVELHTLDLISSGAPLHEILVYICMSADRMLPGAISTIMLMREDGHLQCGAAPHFPPAFADAVQGLPIGPAAGSCGTAAWRREPVITEDVERDPLWTQYLDSARRFDFRACWSTPIICPQGKVLGTFAIYYRDPRTPEASDRAYIERISRFVQIAIERTHQAEQLRASENRYRSIFDLVQVSIWEEDWHGVSELIDRLRQQGVHDLRTYFQEHHDTVLEAIRSVSIVNMNPASLRIFEAHSKDELTGSLAVVFSTPDTIPGFIDQLVAYAEGARHHQGELMVRTRTGKAVHVLLSLSFPAPDEAQRPVLVSLMDVTERKVAEERFRTIAQTTNDLVWDLDVATGKIWWQDGYGTRLARARNGDQRSLDNWTALLHPDERDQVTSSFFEALQGDATEWSREYRFLLPNERWGRVLGRCHIIRHASGEAHRAIGSMLDVTEQRELEAQLAQSQRLEALGQLTGGIAHDFNNLLTVMLGNADILTSELGDQADLQQLAQMTRDAAQRGSELTSRLLAFARRQDLQPEPTDAGALIDAMAPLLRRSLGEEVSLAVEQSGGLWATLVDGAQLESALLNLCLNARDAMPRGGRLWLSAGNVRLDETSPDQSTAEPRPTAGDYVCISVCDNGLGMDSATLERAFEPFFTTKEAGRGNGLGLSMVYGFVTQSQGHITLQSTPGEGTRVTLYLPRTHQQPRSADGNHLEPEPRGDEHVLVVEDNDLVRSYATTQLQVLGYRVTSVADGLAALQALASAPPVDLLFTDIVMPGGISGTELMSRARSEQPDLRVLLTTGFAKNSKVVADKLDQNAELLRKPYQRSELARALRRLLDTP